MDRVKTSRRHRFRALAAIVAVASSGAALAAGSASHEHPTDGGAGSHSQQGHHKHDVDWGAPGEPGQVSRVIEVTMGDNYFAPDALEVVAGETIRFTVTNSGKLLHEFNIGTHHTHQEHQQEMAGMLAAGAITATSVDREKMAHAGMHHDDANSVLLAPGEEADLLWQFSKAKELHFACNVPGHYQAGMVGTLTVR